MSRILSILLSLGILSAVPVSIGCDREVAHDETVKKNPDGSTSKSETTTKEKADGTVVKETDKSKTAPNP
jgi:hypothetical protein